MSIINLASDGLPSALVVLWRALLEFGPMPRKRLLELCAPESVANEKQARQTLSTWIALRGFDENNDTGDVRVSKSFVSKNIDDVEWLRDRVLTCLLSQDAATAAPEFAAAAAWLLSQDPYRFPPSGEDVVLLATNQGFKAFPNSAWWTGFVTWARFVGLVVPAKTLIINPVRLVRHAIRRDRFTSAKNIPINDFLEALSEEVPVLQPGAQAQAMLRSLTNPPRPLAAHEISPVLSLALRQLQYERALRLETLSDSKVRMQLLGRQARPLEDVTHVVLSEAAQ